MVNPYPTHSLLKKYNNYGRYRIISSTTAGKRELSRDAGNKTPDAKASSNGKRCQGITYSCPSQYNRDWRLSELARENQFAGYDSTDTSILGLPVQYTGESEIEKAQAQTIEQLTAQINALQKELEELKKK